MSIGWAIGRLFGADISVDHAWARRLPVDLAVVPASKCFSLWARATRLDPVFAQVSRASGETGLGEVTDTPITLGCAKGRAVFSASTPSLRFIIGGQGSLAADSTARGPRAGAVGFSTRAARPRPEQDTRRQACFLRPTSYDSRSYQSLCSPKRVRISDHNHRTQSFLNSS